jgi:hypothetical protein
VHQDAEREPDDCRQFTQWVFRVRSFQRIDCCAWTKPARWDVLSDGMVESQSGLAAPKRLQPRRRAP